MKALPFLPDKKCCMESRVPAREVPSPRGDLGVCPALQWQVVVLWFLIAFCQNICAQNTPSYFTCEKYLNKHFNEVAFPTTHNSFNYLFGPKTFIYPNQRYDIPTQLNDGIRGFMIDIHHYNGFNPLKTGSNEVMVFHQYASLGNQSLSSVLDYFNAFLSTHPKEICTIIFDCDVPDSKEVAAVFETHPVIKYVYHHDSTQAWPTLQEMVNKNQRLVIISHCKSYSDWYLNQNEYCFENDYNNHHYSDYQCKIIRGDSSKSIFIFNHFLYGALNRKHKNKKANSYNILMDHAQKCSEALHHIPNFVTVDWYDKGDLFKVVSDLNPCNPRNP